MKKILLLGIFILFLVLQANAKYKQTCVVRYMTQEGWSKKYTLQVTFMSGSELNTATNSFNYSSFSTYAIIFWDDDQASIIKLSTFLSCGQTVDESCITNTIEDLKGKDQKGDEWKICVSNYCY